jgi:hypothetical protein
VSSGHAHRREHTEQDEQHVRKLVADKRFQAYMRRPWEQIWHPMVLTGGSSKSGRLYYLDPQLQRDWHTNRGWVKLSRFVLLHERAEKAFREALGLSYDVAHHYATIVEKWAVEAAGINWARYKGIMAKIVRTDERERPDFPAGFDMVPVNEWRHARQS